MGDYRELLRDPRWQRKRLEIMQRDGFRCRECHATTRTLNVHHTHYVKGRAPWEYPDADLRTLCEDCHEQATVFLALLAKVIGRLTLRQLAVLVEHFDDALADLAIIALSAPAVCAICGTHRGLRAGGLLCGSCRYDPFADLSFVDSPVGEV